MKSDAYFQAQHGLALIKGAIHSILSNGPTDGLTNAEVGRSLGIYGGHVGHEGHISRTLLAVLESEGVATQNAETKKWTIRS